LFIPFVYLCCAANTQCFDVFVMMFIAFVSLCKVSSALSFVCCCFDFLVVLSSCSEQCNQQQQTTTWNTNYKWLHSNNRQNCSQKKMIMENQRMMLEFHCQVNREVHASSANEFLLIISYYFDVVELIAKLNGCWSSRRFVSFG
jgi:hypothetical protein